MTYPGGKNAYGVYQKIINHIPPHDKYIELFLGSGAILRRKRPAKRNIGVDLDPQSLNTFRSFDLDVELHCEDALSYLEQVKPTLGNADFIYCDPPYLLGVRSCKRAVYKYEFATEADHRRLIEYLRMLPCQIMVSGYESTLYSNFLNGWNTYVFNARTRSGKTAQEKLWMNYDLPMTLHDYTYLGSNFREREQIKLKVRRWRTKLERLDILERKAILSAINETYF